MDETVGLVLMLGLVSLLTIAGIWFVRSELRKPPTDEVTS
jgi:hypothetical protein